MTVPATAGEVDVAEQRHRQADPELDVVVEAQVRISVLPNVLCKSGTPRQVSMPSFVMPSNDARAAAAVRAS